MSSLPLPSLGCPPCHVHRNCQVPQSVLDQLEPIKDNEEAVRKFGIHQGTEMCQKLLAHGIKALHMYTLNLEKASVSILQVGYSQGAVSVQNTAQ